MKECDNTENKLDELQNSSVGYEEILSLLILADRVKKKIKSLFSFSKIKIENSLELLRGEGIDVEMAKRSFLISERVLSGDRLTEDDYSDACKAFKKIIEKLDDFSEFGSKRLVLNIKYFFYFGFGSKIIRLVIFVLIFLSFGVQYMAHTRSGNELVLKVVEVSDFVRNGILVVSLFLMLSFVSIVFFVFALDKSSFRGKK